MAASTKGKQIAALETEVLKTTMLRYVEHRKQYGAHFDRAGHGRKTIAMIEACRKLYEATNAP